jgi:hypothetical protein
MHCGLSGPRLGGEAASGGSELHGGTFFEIVARRSMMEKPNSILSPAGERLPAIVQAKYAHLASSPSSAEGGGAVCPSCLTLHERPGPNAP